MVVKTLAYCRKLAPWMGASVLIIVCISSIISAQSPTKSITLQTFYGNMEVSEPVLIDIIESKEMQRLKKIHQYGIARYVAATEGYSRYEHSLGVFFLLHKYNLSLEEQMAGLLHDVSHTVFSHVGDYVFHHHSDTSSYQDDIHTWYLQNSSLIAILSKYGFSIDDIHHKDASFLGLEQPLPHLCADRIDYNLQGGVRRGLISPNDVEQILADLHFDGEQWYFTSAESAKKLGLASLIMTETLWSSAWNILTYSWIAEAIRKATEIGLVSFNDIHFSTDNIIWHKMLTTEDPLIKDRIHRSLNYEKYFTLCAPNEETDLLLKGKFRGINPLILTERGLQPLTDVDAQYAYHFNQVKQLIQSGWRIKLTSVSNATAHAAASTADQAH